MQQEEFDRILNQIARISGTSAELVRQKMEQAMETAQSDPQPAVQAMWDSIPRSGCRATLEEFMDHLVKKKVLRP